MACHAEGRGFEPRHSRHLRGIHVFAAVVISAREMLAVQHRLRYHHLVPHRFADVKAELESVLASELSTRKFSYPRTDGSPWTLALKDVLDRAAELEMAYNLNDCVELRWGAPAKSEEASTCKRYAPAAQRGKMQEYRAWFHERRRPPRA